MSTEYIPAPHLRHVLTKCLRATNAPKELRERLLGNVNFGDSDEKAEIYAYLKRHDPGVMEHLANIWAFYSQRAVYVWLLPYLEGEGAAAAVPARYRKHLSEDWWQIDVAHGETVTIRKIRLEGVDLHAEVWLTKPVSFEFEEEEKHDKRTEKVPLRVHFGSNRVPLVEVYASTNDAKKALYAFLTWLRGSPLPSKKELAKILTPLTFSEGLVVKLGAKHGWGSPNEIHGPDPENEVGGIAYKGHKKGLRQDHLDEKADKVKRQLTVRNDSRRYMFVYAHDDGFKEEREATFHFSGHTRVQFVTRTSRLAMDWMIEEIRDRVKAGK